ncbi:hypothetical protein [Microbacterium sp. A93]|uniref:hypothetical protein n=1 Tax=Microbacterium sp. A93 TaxID=3450716 RepID=UPI003F42FDCE
MTKIKAAMGVMGAIVLLSGCAATAPESENAEKPDAVTSAEPVVEPAGWVAPDSCTSLSLLPGNTLAGDALGACVEEIMPSLGSGKEILHNSYGTGQAVFRFVPDFALQGTTAGSSGGIGVTFLGDQMWVDFGNGPVKGDVNSTDPEEVIAGAASELYRFFTLPSTNATMVASSPSWNVSEIETVDIGNGETAEAYRITSTEPFTWLEMPVDEYVLWFAPDWTPVGSESTATMMGVTETSRQTYYDMGEPVEITPVE